MSLKKSSMVALLLLFILFFAAMFSNIWLLTRSNDSLDNVNKEIRVVLSIIDPINHSRTLRVRLMEYMKMINTPGLQVSSSGLNGAEEVIKKADAAFRAYMASPKYPGEQALADDYRDSWLAYRQQGIQPLFDAAKIQNQAAFDAQLATVIRLDRQYEIVLDKVLALHERYAGSLNADAQRHFNTGIGIIIAFCVLFLIVVVTVLVLLRRFVLAPLNDARDYCSQISQGILNNPLPLKQGARSEIQALMASMEQMRLSLTGIIRQVRDSTDTVTTASQAITAGSIDLASRTEQQAAALTQTAASMEELSATVKQNTDNVMKASQLTREAVKGAKSGESVSREVIVTMERINSSSKKIEDITSVINSIAFQTNILALNAAVEAARAGEQGRGFAVVAGEVRSLAQRCAVAAKEIETLISESVVSIRTGSEQVSKTGEAISAIISSVNQVDELMDHISMASAEQSRGIGQIELAVTEMDTVTQKNATLVQQSTIASASLEEQVHFLTQSVSAFRLSTES